MPIGPRRLALLATLLAAAGCSDSSGPDEPAGAPRIVFQSRRDGNTEIYSMAADGSDQRNLTQHPLNDYLPAWSPDHRRIAFVSDRAPAGIWIMNADGSDPRPVGQGMGGSFPAWSPDGSRIAFSSPGSGLDEIWTVRPDGTGLALVTRATFTSTYIISPTWSPDGRRIAYNQGSRIFVTNADGTGEATAITPGSFDGSPSWSPVGARIAFDREEAGAISVWTVAPDGSGLARLTTPPANGFDAQPSWSPDGTRLLFVRAEERSADADIWVMNADGSGARNLTSHPGGNQRPSW